MVSGAKIVVMIPSYNNCKWYDKNLMSVLSQDYDNFRIIYTDDCSTDKTGELVKSFLEKKNYFDKVTFIQNTERLGALANQYNMVHSCDDDEIVITLDGDDWFANAQVLRRVEQAYADGKTWITYGQYKDWPSGGRGCSRPIPKEIIDKNCYRTSPWCTSHLRTFYAWLFKKIKREDLMDGNGQFYQMTGDLFTMFPMIEMAGYHSKYIDDILYIYNVSNPINDSKVNRTRQIDLERIARYKPRYTPLKEK